MQEHKSALIKEFHQILVFYFVLNLRQVSNFNTVWRGRWQMTRIPTPRPWSPQPIGALTSLSRFLKEAEHSNDYLVLRENWCPRLHLHTMVTVTIKQRQQATCCSRNKFLYPAATQRTGFSNWEEPLFCFCFCCPFPTATHYEEDKRGQPIQEVDNSRFPLVR
jgi:hypothetical protein